MHTENTTLSIMYRAIERLELSGRDVVLMARPSATRPGFSSATASTCFGATTVWMDVWNPARRRG
jgi:hypothetical protein